MTEAMYAEILQNEEKQKKLNKLECNTLEERLSRDATFFRVSLNTLKMWYQHYSGVENSHEMKRLSTIIREDEILCEYFECIMLKFPSVKYIDLDLLEE